MDLKKVESNKQRVKVTANTFGVVCKSCSNWAKLDKIYGECTLYRVVKKSDDYCSEYDLRKSKK